MSNSNRLRVAMAVALLACPGIASAQIAYDAISDGGLGVAVSSLSWSHTTTGSDRVLFCGAWGDVDNDYLTATYNGTSMTVVDKGVNSGDRYTYLFRLVAPATGANTVTLTSSGGNIFIYGACASYTGVDQTTPVTAYTKDLYTGAAVTSRTVSVTTTADNSWTIGVARTLDYPNFNGTRTLVNSTSGFALGDSNAAITPAGSTSLTANSASNTPYAVIVAAFQPVGGGGGGGSVPCLRGLLGVGCDDTVIPLFARRRH